MINTMKIAVITSRFNESVTTELKKGCLSRLDEMGVKAGDVITIDVPGAVEVPFIAKQLAKKNQYDAIICLGAVIRGETGHYDYVCEQVSQGCQQVMMQYDVPVVFGVLTTDNMAQAVDRIGGAHGHKGVDAADAAIEMVTLVHSLRQGDLSVV